MQVRDIALLSTRMFKTNPSRTWLTILGMGVGTGAVVALVGFKIGGEFVVGYGIDYAGKHRGLPYIGYIEQEH
jgi:hypothetical protein